MFHFDNIKLICVKLFSVLNSYKAGVAPGKFRQGADASDEGANYASADASPGATPVTKLCSSH